MGGKYHVSGAKAASFILFLKRKTFLSSTDIQHLSGFHLGGNLIKRVFEQKFLGLKVSVKNPDSKDDNKDFQIRNRFFRGNGYYVFWPLVKLKKLAYRMQKVNCFFIPPVLKMMVRSYIVGTIRFCAPILFLRSSKEDRFRVNFYYAMAMAAICGLQTAEIVGLTACKNTSLRDDSSELRKLLELTGCPSVEDMAISGARVIVKQSFKFYRDKFVFPSSKRQKLKLYDPAMPYSVAPKYRNTLWCELVKLGNRQMCRETLPSRRLPSAEEKLAILEGTLSPHDLPFIKTPIPKPVDFVQNLWNFCKSQNLSAAESKALFSSFCRIHFSTFDPQERRVNFRTPSNRLVRMCSNLLPDHTLSPNLKSCVLCGDNCTDISSGCITCHRPIHSRCKVVLYKYGAVQDWSLLGCPKSFECNHIDFTILPNQARELYFSNNTDLDLSIVKRQVPRCKSIRFVNGSLLCKYCNQNIEITNINHVFQCKELVDDEPVPRKLRRLDVTSLSSSSKDQANFRRVAIFLGRKIKIDSTQLDANKRSKR